MNNYKKQIYDILVAFLGESKGGYYENADQFQFGCPQCVANHGEQERERYNLEVSIDKGLFQCWKCSNSGDDMSGTIGKLIKKFGGGALYQKFQEVLLAIKSDKFLRLPEYVTLLQYNAPREQIKLPEDFTVIEPNDLRTMHGYNYLQNRGVGIELIKKFNIGFIDGSCKEFKYKNRVIIPSYDLDGNLNYWTGRSIYDKRYLNIHKIPRYQNPKIARENIIFNEARINWDADITLVEGPFDALVYPNMIPMLSKKMTPDFKLFQTLFEKARANINIFLDGDAYRDVKSLYRELDRGVLKGRIRYVPVEQDMDPADIYRDYGKIGVIKHIGAACKIKEFYLMNL